MVIRCFRDDLADFVHDDFMGRLQSNAPVSAAAMVRNLSNPVPGPGVPTHPLLHPKPRPVTRARKD